MGVFSAPISISDANAAIDVVELTAPSGTVVAILEVEFGQIGFYQDANAQALHVSLNRASAGGSGGTLAVTSVAHGTSGTASSVIDVGNTTRATQSARFKNYPWNIQAPFRWTPTPEMQIFVPPSGIFVVGIEDTPPTGTFEVLGSITYAEL